MPNLERVKSSIKIRHKVMKIYMQDPKLQRKYVYQGQALPGINFFVKIDY